MRYTLLLALVVLIGTSCARPITQFSVAEEAEKLPAGQEINFTQEAEPGVTYLWEFGDGTTSTEATPSHRFLNSGTYTVKLTATNEKGKSATRNERITIAPPEKCLVSIQTPMGTMIAEIFDRTPQHQDNFVKLVEEGYYDSLLFHRVIQGFMIQGGDPDSKGAPAGSPLGMGGPGYTIKAEFVDSLAHVKGALAAARTNNPQKRSSGSQFYIVQGKEVTEQVLNRQEASASFRYPSYVREEYLEMGGTPFLDQGYTVFGRVIEGLEVIDAIAAVRTNAANRPDDDVWMIIKLIR